MEIEQVVFYVGMVSLLAYVIFLLTDIVNILLSISQSIDGYLLKIEPPKKQFLATPEENVRESHKECPNIFFDDSVEMPMDIKIEPKNFGSIYKVDDFIKDQNGNKHKCVDVDKIPKLVSYTRSASAKKGWETRRKNAKSLMNNKKHITKALEKSFKCK